MSGTSRNRRILIVDDQRVISDTLATIFKNAGCDAKAFTWRSRRLNS